MRIAPFKTRGTRRVATAAVGGTMAIAIIGGSLLSTTAANADTLSCLTSNGTTQLISTTGSGAGLINLGNPGGLIGIATGANGTQIGLLSCAAVVSIGGSTPGTTTATITTPVTTTPTTPTTPTVPTTTPTVPTTTTTTDPAPTPTSTTTTTPTTSTPTKVSTVKVSSSTATVYPSAKGYKHSKVTFSVKGLTSAKGAVKLTGKAVLRKGTKVVKTWKISNATTKLTWNGKVGTKVKAGVYKLTVTAWSSDGTKKVTKTTVHVSGKHLVTKKVSMATRDLANATTNKLPAAVRKAFKYGKVTFRIHTVAEVTGPANLVITGPKGQKVVVPLKDGSHTTKAAVLKKGFTSAKFTHDWKTGDAKLLSLRTTFSYKTLV